MPKMKILLMPESGYRNLMKTSRDAYEIALLEKQKLDQESKMIQVNINGRELRIRFVRESEFVRFHTLVGPALDRQHRDTAKCTGIALSYENYPIPVIITTRKRFNPKEFKAKD